MTPHYVVEYWDREMNVWVLANVIKWKDQKKAEKDARQTKSFIGTSTRVLKIEPEIVKEYA